MSASLPSLAYAAALASLPRMTPHRLSMVLRRWSPAEAWDCVTSLRPEPWLAKLCIKSEGVPQEWSRAPLRSSPERVWDDCARTSTQVVMIGEPSYPACLADDRFAPAVLFARGNWAALDHRRAAIIGTRNATETGRNLARRFGAQLAEQSITIVSGLARGIDGWAHRGVLDVDGAPPVAVVASGPDVPFPREHRDLWNQVAERGLLVSEHAPGAPPLAEWFPLRNRIIAGLSEVLVVIESRAKGGSMLTVREALARGITVMAVPGSLSNAAAAGTNRLLADGAQAVLDSADVLVALGLDTSRVALPFDPRVAPKGLERRVLEAFGGDTLSVDELIARTGLDLVEAAVAVGRLESAGWLRNSGSWFEPVARQELAR
jgi:DNA processing protein